MHYNDDGTIDEVPYWNEVPELEPVGAVCPFKRVEAETIAWSDGVKSARRDSVGMVITHIHNTDYIRVRNVDFGDGAKRFTAAVASESKSGTIELRLDRLDGTLIGECQIGSTGGKDKWLQRSCQVQKIGGRHDLYLVFRGRHKAELFDFDWWRFDK